MVQAVRRSRLTLILLLGLLVVVAGGRMATLNVRPSASQDDRLLPVVAVPGYHVSLFTSASARAEGKAPVLNPDSVAVDGKHVFIDYQNITPKTGGGLSTVVEYDMEGRELNRWSASGHSGGMRIDPVTHKIWTTEIFPDYLVLPAAAVDFSASASVTSTISPSMLIWISLLTMNLPSSIASKLMPKSLRLILVSAA